MQTRLPLLGFCVMESVHKMILLDDEDKWLLEKYNWCLGNGYAVGRVNKKVKRIHHFIIPKKEGFDIDHINRNRLDNRRCNLRYVTHRENCMNSSMKKNNTSGFRGVYWRKDTKKWAAWIGFKGKSYHLGSFSIKKLAINKYQSKAKELFGEYLGEVKL